MLHDTVRSCSGSVNFISVVFLNLLNTFLKTLASCLSYVLKCYKLTQDINWMFHKSSLKYGTENFEAWNLFRTS
jgi:hypothetical protein